MTKSYQRLSLTRPEKYFFIFFFINFYKMDVVFEYPGIPLASKSHGSISLY